MNKEPVFRLTRLSFDEPPNNAECARVVQLEGTSFRLGAETSARLAKASSVFRGESAVQILLRGFRLLELLHTAKKAGYELRFYDPRTQDSLTAQQVDEQVDGVPPC